MDHAEHFRLRRVDYLVIILLGLAQAATVVGFALLLRGIIDAMAPAAVGAAYHAAFQAALLQCAALAGLAVVSGALRAAEFSWAERAGYEVVRRLRMTMYEHMQGMLPSELRHRARGGLLLRLTGDLSMARMWLSRGLLQGTASLIIVVAGIAVVIVLDPWIGLAMLFALAATAAVSALSGRAMRSSTRLMRRRRSLVIGNIDEQINALAVQQVGGRTRGERDRLSRQNDDLTEALITVAGLRGRLRGVALTGSILVTALVLLVGLVQVRAGFTEVGTVVAALVVSRLVSGRVRSLGLAHDYWHRNLVSQQKIAEFLSSSSSGWDRPELERLRVRRGAISFEGVTAGAVRDLTMVVPGGRIVGITGPSGAGKSTLLRLVACQQLPEEGRVLVDDQDLATVNPLSVARQIGYESADLPLLRGSILRNITYNERDASAMEVQRVAYSLGLESVLRRHGGVDAWLTEGGSNLSLGERQLVSLTRALVGNPPILLLDEPLSSLDAESRRVVLDHVTRYRGTVLFISHDAQELARTDEVWTMYDGRIIDISPGSAYAARNPWEAVA